MVWTLLFKPFHWSLNCSFYLWLIYLYSTYRSLSLVANVCTPAITIIRSWGGGGGYVYIHDRCPYSIIKARVYSHGKWGLWLLIMKFSEPIQPHHFAVKESIRHQNNMKKNLGNQGIFWSKYVKKTKSLVEWHLFSKSLLNN